MPGGCIVVGVLVPGTGQVLKTQRGEMSHYLLADPMFALFLPWFLASPDTASAAAESAPAAQNSSDEGRSWEIFGCAVEIVDGYYSPEEAEKAAGCTAPLVAAYHSPPEPRLPEPRPPRPRPLEPRPPAPRPPEPRPI